MLYTIFQPYKKYIKIYLKNLLNIYLKNDIIPMNIILHCLLSILIDKTVINLKYI